MFQFKINGFDTTLERKWKTLKPGGTETLQIESKLKHKCVSSNGPLYRIKFLITPVNKGFLVASFVKAIVPRIGEDEVVIIGKCQGAKLAALGESSGVWKVAR